MRLADFSIIVVGILFVVSLVAIAIVARFTRNITLSNTDNLGGLATSRVPDKEAPSNKVITSGMIRRGDAEIISVNGLRYEVGYDGRLLFNGEQRPFSFVFNKYYFHGEEEAGGLKYYITLLKDAPVCDGITGSIKQLGTRAVCCAGEVTELPDCASNWTISCGDRIIECVDGRLVTKVAG